MSDNPVDIALAYALKLVGSPYSWWHSGMSLNRNAPPAWGVDGPPPDPAAVKRGGVFCAGVGNLMRRAAGLPVPKNGSWPGGTKAWEMAFRMEPFVLSEVRRGDVLFRPYQHSGRLDQGHWAVALGGPDDKVLQSIANSTATVRPGVNTLYTARQSHDGGYYVYRIPRENWLGKVVDGGGNKPDREPKQKKDEPLWGLDIASHQGYVNMGLVKSEGYTFVVSKATEGTYYQNPYYKDSIKRAKAQGLVTGAYHFLTNGDIDKQVDNFLSVTGRDLDGMLVMVDVEAEPYPDVVYDPRSIHVQRFIQELRQRIGDHPVAIYSGAWYWQPNIGVSVQKMFKNLTPGKDIVTWDANYVSGTGYGSTLYYRHTAPWAERWGGVGHKFLQFTDRAAVAGQQMDANAFNGTKAQLLELTTTRLHTLEPDPVVTQPEPRKPAPEPEPEPEPQPEPAPEPEPEPRPCKCKDSVEPIPDTTTKEEDMNALKKMLKNEPALVTSIVVALINLAVGAGYIPGESISPEDTKDIAESVVIILSGVLVRSQVSPKDKKKPRDDVRGKGGHRA